MGSCCARLPKNEHRSKRATQEKPLDPESGENHENLCLSGRKCITLLPNDHPMANYVFPRISSEGAKSVNSL